MKPKYSKAKQSEDKRKKKRQERRRRSSRLVVGDGYGSSSRQLRSPATSSLCKSAGHMSSLSASLSGQTRIKLPVSLRLKGEPYAKPLVKYILPLPVGKPTVRFLKKTKMSSPLISDCVKPVNTRSTRKIICTGKKSCLARAVTSRPPASRGSKAHSSISLISSSSSLGLAKKGVRRRGNSHLTPSAIRKRLLVTLSPESSSSSPVSSPSPYPQRSMRRRPRPVYLTHNYRKQLMWYRILRAERKIKQEERRLEEHSSKESVTKNKVDQGTLDRQKNNRCCSKGPMDSSSKNGKRKRSPGSEKKPLPPSCLARTRTRRSWRRQLDSSSSESPESDVSHFLSPSRADSSPSASANMPAPPAHCSSTPVNTSLSRSCSSTPSNCPTTPLYPHSFTSSALGTPLKCQLASPNVSNTPGHAQLCTSSDSKTPTFTEQKLKIDEGRSPPAEERKDCRETPKDSNKQGTHPLAVTAENKVLSLSALLDILKTNSSSLKSKAVFDAAHGHAANVESKMKSVSGRGFISECELFPPFFSPCLEEVPKGAQRTSPHGPKKKSPNKKSLSEPPGTAAKTPDTKTCASALNLQQNSSSSESHAYKPVSHFKKPPQSQSFNLRGSRGTKVSHPTISSMKSSFSPVAAASHSEPYRKSKTNMYTSVASKAEYIGQKVEGLCSEDLENKTFCSKPDKDNTGGNVGVVHSKHATSSSTTFLSYSYNTDLQASLLSNPTRDLETTPLARSTSLDSRIPSDLESSQLSCLTSSDSRCHGNLENSPLSKSTSSISRSHRDLERNHIFSSTSSSARINRDLDRSRLFVSTSPDKRNYKDLERNRLSSASSPEGRSHRDLERNHLNNSTSPDYSINRDLGSDQLFRSTSMSSRGHGDFDRTDLSDPTSPDSRSHRDFDRSCLSSSSSSSSRHHVDTERNQLSRSMPPTYRRHRDLEKNQLSNSSGSRSHRNTKSNPSVFPMSKGDTGRNVNPVHSTYQYWGRRLLSRSTSFHCESFERSSPSCSKDYANIRPAPLEDVPIDKQPFPNSPRPFTPRTLVTERLKTSSHKQYSFKRPLCQLKPHIDTSSRANYRARSHGTPVAPRRSDRNQRGYHKDTPRPKSFPPRHKPTEFWPGYRNTPNWVMADPINKHPKFSRRSRSARYSPDPVSRRLSLCRDSSVCPSATLNNVPSPPRSRHSGQTPLPRSNEKSQRGKREEARDMFTVNELTVGTCRPSTSERASLSSAPSDSSNDTKVSSSPSNGYAMEEHGQKSFPLILQAASLLQGVPESMPASPVPRISSRPHVIYALMSAMGYLLGLPPDSITASDPSMTHKESASPSATSSTASQIHSNPASVIQESDCYTRVYKPRPELPSLPDHLTPPTSKSIFSQK